MKPKMMVHGSYARTVSNPTEVERLLAAGWLLAQPKPKTAMAARMRTLRARRRAEGWTVFTLWASGEDADAIRAAQRPGETLVEMIIRLARKQSLL
ncbi:hypothetical protein N5D53_10995 [Pseudomonas sp. GD03862]|uniref:hypothetical protein n=1 Tax=Pseudomonas sp. GD03862 TaxID=2975391 RepID=UPI002446C953|nr:hypothetical protein [Pseudomonas sp. GD03862]MDH0707043.1 hypothetical protein [Pseudomonas sp. GD03862]